MHHNLNNFKGKNVIQQSGFGLVELLVSISIVVLVTSIILIRQTSYNGAVLLRSEAYELALQARDIQLSAVSVFGNNAGNFRNVYGLYFNTSVSPNFYYNFRDADGDFFYSNGEQIGKLNNLDTRFKIDEVRLVDGASETVETDIAVVFERPNFDARFFTAANTEVDATVSAVEIDIRVSGTSGDAVNEVRTVEITKTGQITVQ